MITQSAHRYYVCSVYSRNAYLHVFLQTLMYLCVFVRIGFRIWNNCRNYCTPVNISQLSAIRKICKSFNKKKLFVYMLFPRFVRAYENLYWCCETHAICILYIVLYHIY